MGALQVRGLFDLSVAQLTNVALPSLAKPATTGIPKKAQADPLGQAVFFWSLSEDLSHSKGEIPRYPIYQGIIGSIMHEGELTSQCTEFLATVLLRSDLAGAHPVFGFTSNLGKFELEISNRIR